MRYTSEGPQVMRNPDLDGRFARSFVPDGGLPGIDLSNMNIRIRGMSEQPGARVEIRVREQEESKAGDHR